MKTRAAVLTRMGAPAPYAGSRPLEILEVDLAPPGPGEVLLRVRAAGLCHSDLSVIDGNRPRPLPLVLGHEGAGVVEEIGAGVTVQQLVDKVSDCGHVVPFFAAFAALTARARFTAGAASGL
jgi:alcohol dehydrogenase